MSKLSTIYNAQYKRRDIVKDFRRPTIAEFFESTHDYLYIPTEPREDLIGDDYEFFIVDNDLNYLSVNDEEN